MEKWRKTIKLKYLFAQKEDYESIQKSMTDIANILKNHAEFVNHFDNFEEFYNLPEQRTLAVANSILDDMYTIADYERIWIE